MKVLNNILFLLTLFFSILATISSGGQGSPPGNTQNQGATRNFKLAIVPLPENWTPEKIDAAYDLASNTGEVVSLSENLSWTNNELIDRYDYSIKKVRENGAEVWMSVDIFNSIRTEIANLPAELTGKDFSDNELRANFLREVTELANRYKPEYLMLGMEVNGYQLSHQEDFSNFVSLYRQAFVAIKAVSANTRVAVTFQYEVLKSNNQWNLIETVNGNLDIICFTSYPGLAMDSIESLPPDYYSDLEGYTDKPIVFTEIGFRGYDNPEAEKTQAALLSDFFQSTSTIEPEIIIYSLLHDWQGGDVFSTMGLIDNSGRRKAVWDTWVSFSELEYRP